jgi:hypothetical protein
MVCVTYFEPSMSMTLETLKAEVLRLSSAERAELLDRLIASLHVDDDDADAAWDAVAERREQQLDAGSAQAVPLDVAIARAESRFRLTGES